MKNVLLFIVLGLFAVGCYPDNISSPLGPDDFDGFFWKCPSKPNQSYQTEGACEIDYECPEQCYQCEDNWDC